MDYTTIGYGLGGNCECGGVTRLTTGEDYKKCGAVRHATRKQI